MERGVVVQSSGPARSERGPRRAAPATRELRAPHWDAPLLPRHKVVAIGGGKFRVITTVEQVVSEEELTALGLEVPPEDLPWQAPKPVHAADRAAALQHWTNLLGGYDPRLTSRIGPFLGEFGLDALKAAINQVAATNPTGGAGVKYAQLVRVLREIRERGTT